MQRIPQQYLPSYRFRPPRRPTSVQHKSNIFLHRNKNLFPPLTSHFPLLHHIQNNPSAIAVTLRNRSPPLRRSSHHGSPFLIATFRNKDKSDVYILEIEIELGLLVARVERRDDASLPGRGEKRNYEFVGVGERGGYYEGLGDSESYVIDRSAMTR